MTLQAAVDRQGTHLPLRERCRRYLAARHREAHAPLLGRVLAAAHVAANAQQYKALHLPGLVESPEMFDALLGDGWEEQAPHHFAFAPHLRVYVALKQQAGRLAAELAPPPYDPPPSEVEAVLREYLGPRYDPARESAP